MAGAFLLFVLLMLPWASASDPGSAPASAALTASVSETPDAVRLRIQASGDVEPGSVELRFAGGKAVVQAVEATLHIRPAQVAAALEGGDNLILLDVRAPEEWEAGHIEGARLATVELTFEILDSWPKDTRLVLY